MKTWIAGIALLMAASAAADGIVIRPFTANYEGSVSLGTLACKTTLARNPDGSYTYKSESHAIGFASMFFKDVIVETSRFEVVDGRPRSLEYDYVRSGGKHDKSESIRFDWNNKVAHTDDNGTKRDHRLLPGVSDRFLIQLILSLDNEAGSLQDEYGVLDHNAVTWFNPKKLPDASVRTASGKYETQVLERQDKGDARVTDFWQSPELHYLPVQIEQREPGEDTYTLSLTSVSFEGAAPAASTAPKQPQ
ncbi:MAG: DUF3108 domain-containing protein [Bacillota bacterium]